METFAKLNTVLIKLQNENDLSSRSEASCTVMGLQLSRVLSREVDVCFSYQLIEFSVTKLVNEGRAYLIRVVPVPSPHCWNDVILVLTKPVNDVFNSSPVSLYQIQQGVITSLVN